MNVSLALKQVFSCFVLAATLIILTPLLPAKGLAAETTPEDGEKEACTKFETSWNDIEQQYWQALCRDAQTHSRAQPRPSNTKITTVRPEFLADLLLKDPYRKTIFDERPVLDYFEVKGPLRLVNHTLPGPLYFYAFSFDDELVFDHITVTGTLIFQSGNIQTLYLSGSHVTGPTVFYDVTLDCESSYCKPKELVSFKAERAFFEDGLFFNHVSLNHTSLAFASFNDLEFRSTTATSINLSGATFARPLTMLDGSEFGGKCNANSNPIGVNLDGIHAKSDVKLMGTFYSTVTMNNAVIDGSLVLSNGRFTLLDASNAHISGQLVVGAGRPSRITDVEKLWPSWKDESTFILDNARINEISSPQDMQAWPKHLALREFSFESFIPEVSRRAPEKSESEWFISWLAATKQHPHAPQPYQRVSSFLQKSGYTVAAADVAVAGKDLEREEVCANHNWPQCIYLWASFLTIGYGYRIYYSAIGVFVLTLLGWSVFATDKAAAMPISPWRHIPLGLAYSLDMLIPVFKLNEDNTKIILGDKWRRRYLYLHKVSGWLLGTFLVAGITGLTK